MRPRSRERSVTAATTSAVVSSTSAAAIASPRGDTTLRSENGARRRAGQPRRHGPRRGTDRPADDHAADRGDRGFDDGEQAELPALGAGPGEARAGRVQVAPHAAGCEQREREKERRRLAADEQQPARADRGAPLGGAKLLLGEARGERARVGEKLGPRPLDVPDEVVHLPEARMSRRKRPDPGVAAVRARYRRRGREAVDAFRDDERRRSRPVVTPGFAQRGSDLGIGSRVVGRLEEVAEELARVERCRPDLDQPQAGCVRERARAAQAQDLAALRGAAAREPARAQRDVLRQSVHRGQARRSGPRRCSRGREGAASARRDRCPRARSGPSGRARRGPRPARPGRRTRRPGPPAPTRECARRPAPLPGRLRWSPPPARRRAPPRRRRARARRRAPRSHGDEGAARRARPRSGRISRAGPPPPPVRGRLRAVPANGHRAPAGRAVPRRVEEEPAAPVLATGLHARARIPTPGAPTTTAAIAPSARDAPSPAGDSTTVASEPSSGRSATPARAASKRARSGSSGASPVVFRSASVRRTSRSSRAATNASASTRSSGSSSPRPSSHAPSSAGVASSSCAKSGISVLTKSWTRSSGGRRGGPPAGLKALEVHRVDGTGATAEAQHRQTVLHGVYNTDEPLSQVFARRFTPCTGRPAASQA